MSKLRYRRGLIISFFATCLAICLWVWLGEPDAEGARYAVKTAEGFTFRGWVMLASGAACIGMTLPHLVNVVLGKPAIELSNGSVRIWAFPRETIPLSDLKQIRVGDQKVEFFRHGEKPRSVNVGPTVDPRLFFFDEVRSHLADPEIICERDEH